MHAIFDRELSLQQAGGSESLARELLGMLLKETPALLAALRSALDAGDHQALWDNAHKIYGSTAYCGVPQLNHAARVLEEAIKGELAREIIAEELKTLEAAFASLKDKAEEMLATPWS